jgi:hypothetical protein
VFTLDRVVPWGRSFDEYRRMFALTDADLTSSIVGCADGPASFNAEATARGHSVISCDPIYRFSTAEAGTLCRRRAADAPIRPCELPARALLALSVSLFSAAIRRLPRVCRPGDVPRGR